MIKQLTIISFVSLPVKHTQAQEMIFCATRGLPLPFNANSSGYLFIILQQLLA